MSASVNIRTTDRPSVPGPSRYSAALVVEGEAPETDDEIEDEQETQREEQLPEISDTVVENVSRVRAHVDERLEQRWRNLCLDTMNLQWKRSKNALQTAEEVENVAQTTLTTVQRCSGVVRHLTDKLCRLQCTFGDLIEGAKLVPDNINAGKL